jgi:hypothetical protein
MAAIDFPASPTNNQTFTSGDKTWIYSTTISAWKLQTQTLTGPTGATGATGATGPSNVLTVGTVTLGEASATITGTTPAQVLNLVLPISGNYTHIQSVSSANWTITHNLGFPPSVSVVDSGGNHVVGDVNYVSANVLTVSFSSPFGGSAYLS